MKDGNKKNDTLKNTMRMIGCELVIYSIATFGGNSSYIWFRNSRWGSDEPGKCVKTTYCDFLGDFESVRERGGKYKQVRKSRDPSTEQPGGRNELSRLKL